MCSGRKITRVQSWLPVTKSKNDCDSRYKQKVEIH